MQVRTAQYKVAMEHLSYHVRCLDTELAPIQKHPVLEPSQVPKDLSRWVVLRPISVNLRSEKHLIVLFIAGARLKVLK